MSKNSKQGTFRDQIDARVHLKLFRRNCVLESRRVLLFQWGCTLKLLNVLFFPVQAMVCSPYWTWNVSDFKEMEHFEEYNVFLEQDLFIFYRSNSLSKTFLQWFQKRVVFFQSGLSWKCDQHLWYLSPVFNSSYTWSMRKGHEKLQRVWVALTVP